MTPAISVKLWTTVGQEQWSQFLDIIEPKLTSPADRALMGAIRAFTSTPDNLQADSNIKKLVAEARVSGAAKTRTRQSAQIPHR